MSILPILFDLSGGTYHSKPRSLLDQHFGLEFLPENMDMMCTIPRRSLGKYIRPWQNINPSLARQDSGSVVSADKNQFRVSLDVQQFSPEEISVKVIENAIVVEGKHEEKQDEHGFVSRQFVRRYVLPDGHDAKDVISSLSSDGVLTVTAPRKTPELPENERVVPIARTGPVHSNATITATQAGPTQDAADN